MVGRGPGKSQWKKEGVNTNEVGESVTNLVIGKFNNE
jgi:hypothetical protein